MRNSPEDPIVRRAVDVLRQLPVEDAAAVRRVVVAAAAAGLPRGAAPQLANANRRARQAWTMTGVAAALVCALIARATLPLGPSRASPAANGVTTARSPVHAVLNTGEAMPVPHQFVFESRDARRVSLVGDFNGWDARSVPMERAANGVWSSVISVLPGRHVYGFMVDDTLFRVDPRVPASRDPDLGTAQSVVLVGRP